MHLLLLPLFSVICLYATTMSCFYLYFICLMPSTYSIYLQAYTASSNKLTYVFMHPSLLIPCSFVTSQSFY
ncbi:hypothetical protein BDF22DRAFT_678888 [Syncephalis plumigaleata]|nr:hypothetical protein BDF22DRAFT_678888 [Syncephalis plumigaleata]